MTKTALELMSAHQRLDAVRTKSVAKAGGKIDPLQAAIVKAEQKTPISGAQVRLGQQPVKSDVSLYSPSGEVKLKPAPPVNTGPLPPVNTGPLPPVKTVPLPPVNTGPIPPDFQRPKADGASTQTPATKPTPQAQTQAPEPIPHIGLAPTPLIEEQ